MKKWNVYATRKILDPAIPIIAKECSVVLNNKSRPPTRSELLAGVRNKDAILCTLSDKIDQKVMDTAGSSLKVISSYSTGVDHIDINEASKRGIYVTTTGDILTEAVADLTFALILATSRRLTQGYEMVTQKRWKIGWDPNLLLGSDVHGMTMGIFGLGRIGSAVACRAKGFNMRIIYYSRHGRNIQINNELGAKYVSMDELVEESDFLSLHSSLNSETYHLIDRSKLRRMKNTAYLINTSRGLLVNEQHLIEALRRKWIAGAGLDVFEQEPPSPNNPLLKLKNVVLLPHLGSATLSTRTRMAEIAAKNLLNVLNGKSPIYAANLEKRK
ncbi:MAG TPA: D-glycerate dehydrogenase [Nitrososphaeraceae archaeon]|nr:D-glycerate dehydrogenase [Nitrososphaeraceae archaeon]